MRCVKAVKSDLQGTFNLITEKQRDPHSQHQDKPLWRVNSQNVRSGCRVG
jgi:hypothetical protein